MDKFRFTGYGAFGSQSVKPPETTSSLEVPSPLDLSDRWALPSQVGSWVRISLPVDTATIPIPIFLGTERTCSLTDNRGEATHMCMTPDLGRPGGFNSGHVDHGSRLMPPP